jgi:outer membrane protein
MKNIKINFITIFIFLFSINFASAENKVSYIDIDYILSNSLAGKSLLTNFKNEEKLKIDKFKLNDEKFKNEEKQILAKKNLISKDELNKELKLLQIKFNEYRENKLSEIEKLKKKKK